MAINSFLNAFSIPCFMALIILQEVIDLVVMIAAIGFIFKDYMNVPDTRNYEPLDYFRRKTSFLGSGFKNAVMVAAPAIALHEAGHKIAALSFGLNATFHAAYTWLGIGVLLKLFNAPFLFFVPGYVSYSGFVEPLGRALIAFSGPLVNLLLFLFATVALRQKWFNGKHTPLLILAKQINLFLFIFNMLPIPGFDGSHVFSGLLQAFA
jgi:Zn-dependent protease